MPRPWTEVIADPNFQALSPQAQESARNAYFQQNVLPNIPKDANAGAIRLQFDQQTKPALTAKQSQPESPSLAMAPVGGAEMLAKRVTGALASIPAGLAYGGAAVGKAFGANVDPINVQSGVQSYLTYQPQTESGQAGEAALRNLVQPVVAPVANAADRAATAIGRVSPTAETFLREAPAAAQAAGGIIGASPLAAPAMQLAGEVPGAIVSGARAIGSGAASAGRKVAQAGETASDAAARALGANIPPKPTMTAQNVVDQIAANSGQSMGAAAAAPRVTGANPELQQAIVTAARKNGGAVNSEAVERQLQADRVGVKLTEGQATREAPLFSEEQNLRGKLVDLADHFNEQNKQLVKKVQDMRDEVGPDVHSTNAVEHGDTLIQAYRDIDTARRADIKAKYQALTDANGGQLPVDGKTLVDNVESALSKQYKARFLPREVRGMLDDFRDGPMTLEGYEALRTTLAAEVRKAARAGDGNAEGALNIVRNHVEDLPLENTTYQVKALADQARAAAKARFDAMRADPAYKAAIDDTVDSDKFVKKFVIGGSRDDVATMAANLQGNDTARKTIAVSVLDHLRDRAGIGPDYKGAFKQSGYNKALMELDPKLHSLVDSRTAETFRDIGDVAHNIQVAPPGSTVNSSNTLTAGMADYAESAVEHAVNAKTGTPIGTLGRKVLQKVTHGTRIKQAIQPGAGIGRLVETSPQVEAMLEAARRKAAAAQQVTP